MQREISTVFCFCGLNRIWEGFCGKRGKREGRNEEERLKWKDEIEPGLRRAV